MPASDHPPSIHSTQGPTEESPPIHTDNQKQNQSSALDTNILAYIDQSLKTLIGPNANNNNNNHFNHLIQTTPFLPTVVLLQSLFFSVQNHFLINTKHFICTFIDTPTERNTIANHCIEYSEPSIYE